MGLQLCGLQVWCWLVSTVLWLVLVERQLNLSSVTARLRAAVGPYVRDCETESLNSIVVSMKWFGYWCCQ
ncbi:hypothetical protein Taro_012585 [Colocasia esculenta]|uniref:Secreted protein n=1 Tax=Colocasia esculenta TaxID=4460 RepID=A0A843UJK1_COLES|nr:hypothetical protein [Colocasia esculenta]